MRRIILLSFMLMLLCTPIHSQNWFITDPKARSIHLVLDVSTGGDFYRSSLSPLYKTDQWVVDGTATLGYFFTSNVFTGIGGGIRHCTNDQKTSFPVAASFLAFASVRYIFPGVILRPYAELRYGTVVYPKWNDFIKPYAAVGGGIHILPRLTAGGRFSWCGTLDNRHTTEITFCVGFCI